MWLCLSGQNPPRSPDSVCQGRGAGQKKQKVVALAACLYLEDGQRSATSPNFLWILQGITSLSFHLLLIFAVTSRFRESCGPSSSASCLLRQSASISLVFVVCSLSYKSLYRLRNSIVQFRSCTLDLLECVGVLISGENYHTSLSHYICNTR